MLHVAELAYELQKEGVPLKNGILTSEEFTEGTHLELEMRVSMSIIVDNISYIYEKGTGFSRGRLWKNVSCAIEEVNLSGLFGHTGSGKSIIYTAS